MSEESDEEKTVDVEQGYEETDEEFTKRVIQISRQLVFIRTGKTAEQQIAESEDYFERFVEDN